MLLLFTRTSCAHYGRIVALQAMYFTYHIITTQLNRWQELHPIVQSTNEHKSFCIAPNHHRDKSRMFISEFIHQSTCWKQSVTLTSLISHGDRAKLYCCSFYSTESQTDGLTATNTTNLLLYWPLHKSLLLPATGGRQGVFRCVWALLRIIHGTND